jgi:branched-chain amino acid transport system substrate-binding protein
MKFQSITRWALTGAALLLALAAPVPSDAQTVKIGVISSYSGAAGGSVIADQMDKAINLYMKQNAAKLAPIQIELIRRDDTGSAPDVARRLAQELITRDRVQFITGLIYTPNANAVAPLATEAKVPTVIMNAGTSSTIRLSPYLARVSFTLWQSSYPLAQWAVKQPNTKKAFTAVADYGPGIDAEQAFTRGFTEGGGEIVGSVRMPPFNPEMTAFLQRAKDAKPDVLFVFVPAGTQATAIMKIYSDLGMPQANIRLIGPGDIVPDTELPNMGNLATDGIVTMHHYSAAAKRPENVAFVDAWKKEYGANATPDFFAVGAWDGMDAIFHAIRAQNGRIDSDRTMDLLKNWQNPASPRGPVRIDAETRDVVQNEYMRRLERVDGKLVNIEFETIPMVKDPWPRFNPPAR